MKTQCNQENFLFQTELNAHCPFVSAAEISHPIGIAFCAKKPKKSRERMFTAFMFCPAGSFASSAFTQ